MSKIFHKYIGSESNSSKACKTCTGCKIYRLTLWPGASELLEHRWVGTIPLRPCSSTNLCGPLARGGLMLGAHVGLSCNFLWNSRGILYLNYPLSPRQGLTVMAAIKVRWCHHNYINDISRKNVKIITHLQVFLTIHEYVNQNMTSSREMTNQSLLVDKFPKPFDQTQCPWHG